jgi:hypothetical protein
VHTKYVHDLQLVHIIIFSLAAILYFAVQLKSQTNIELKDKCKLSVCVDSLNSNVQAIEKSHLCVKQAIGFISESGFVFPFPELLSAKFMLGRNLESPFSLIFCL